MAELEILSTFVTTVRSGSFAAAARVLGLTPAMVGRRIQALERDYGVTLIERTTRAQRLTTAGETLLAHAEALLDSAAELDNAMQPTPARLAGPIRMTAPTTLGVYRLAGSVARFCEGNPAVTVDVVMSDRRADLIAEGFDFAVRIGTLQNSSMISRRVGTYRLWLVASAGFVARHGVPAAPKDIAGFPCLINLNMTPRSQWPFRQGARTEVAEVDGNLRIDNGEALLAAALEGAGLAYLPADLARKDEENGRLVRLLADWETASLPIHLVYPSRRVPRRVEALMEYLSADLKLSHPA